MFKYPLQELLSLRLHRVDEAVLEHKRVLSALTSAILATKMARDELDAYKIYKEEEIERRYLSIKGKTLTQKELETFRNNLSYLNLKELELLEAVQSAIKEEDKLRSDEAVAKEGIVLAKKALTKLEEHKNIVYEAYKIEQERLLDAEMEDFQVKKNSF